MAGTVQSVTLSDARFQKLIGTEHTRLDADEASVGGRLGEQGALASAVTDAAVAVATAAAAAAAATAVAVTSVPPNPVFVRHLSLLTGAAAV